MAGNSEEFIPTDEISLEEETIIQEEETLKEDISIEKKKTSNFLKTCMNEYHEEHPYS